MLSMPSAPLPHGMVLPPDPGWQTLWLAGAAVAVLGACAGATTSDSCRQLLRDHLQAMLLCPDKATLTNLVCTAGGAHAD